MTESGLTENSLLKTHGCFPLTRVVAACILPESLSEGTDNEYQAQPDIRFPAGSSQKI